MSIGIVRFEAESHALTEVHSIGSGDVHAICLLIHEGHPATA